MKRRGMALMLVLTVASVMVMMTGAFVSVNHSNFAGLGASQRQREAELVAESAAEFIYYQLELNQNFANSPFGNSNQIGPAGGGLKVNRVQGRTAIEGTLLDDFGTGRAPTFSAEIYNNLHTLNGTNQGLPVPADSCLIKITGRSGSFVSRCDILYRGEPLFDASVTANKDVTLSTNNNLVITSEDKGRNWLRSNGDVHLNGFASGGGGTTKIVSKAGGPKGVVWAKKRILSGTASGPTDPGLEGAQLSTAMDLSGGILAPKSRLNHDVYKLTPNDLNVGNSQASATGTQSVGSMNPGVYYLANEPVDIGGTTYTVKTLVHTRPDGTSILFYDGRTIPPSAIMPQTWSLTSVRCGADGVVNLGSTTSGESAMTFNFASNAFVADNSQVEVDGDLTILSAIDGEIPNVQLLSSSSSNGVLKATGSITIQGTLSGGGALVAEKDLALACNPQPSSGQGANVDANVNSGVVLYGQNVTVFGASNRNIDFKGLIYADKDVHFMGGAKIVTSGGQTVLDYTSDTLDNLSLQGAVVARTGSVTIGETKDVTLTYDPKYLDALTKGMPDNRRRVARVWTRSY